MARIYIDNDAEWWRDAVQKICIIAECVDVYWDSKSFSPRLKDSKKRGAEAKKEFKKHLPDFIKKSDELADQAWSIATGVNELKVIDDVIDEMTSGVAVTGYGAPLGIYTSSSKSKRKKKKSTKVKRR